jgi:hypothetical protein
VKKAHDVLGLVNDDELTDLEKFIVIDFCCEAMMKMMTDEHVKLATFITNSLLNFYSDKIDKLGVSHLKFAEPTMPGPDEEC